ncbi:MFS transporter [Jatrophihabitans sp. GAS493]|uniref:MFS transporter n=1 Tax=Jatrophihabitans sp. GAS493 TaxID=1907575 RepID=UPI0012FE68AA|nr:MFS transporter [Jatrophihabitans sp. GAS493]
MTVTTGNPTFRDALRVREFRWLWIADTQSALGDQLTRVAISVLVFSRTGSAALTALVFGMTYLPAVLGGLFLSGLADRYPRRRLMVICDAARFVLVLAVAIPSLADSAIIVCVAIEAAMSSLFTTAELSEIPEMLPAEVFPAASALRTISNQLSQVAGFAVGGVVVAVVGPRTGLAVDAASFLLSAAIIQSRTRLRHHPSTKAGNERANLLTASMQGARAVLGDPRLRVLAGLVWLTASLTMREGIAVPYAVAEQGGDVAVGMLLAAVPTGLAVGTFLSTRWLTKVQRLAWMCPAAIAVGLVTVPCGLTSNPSVSVALWVLAGALASYVVVAMAEFTVSVPGRVRGAAVGFAASILIALQGAAIAGAGLISESIGAHRTVALSGGVGAAIGIWLAIRWARLTVST